MPGELFPESASGAAATRHVEVVLKYEGRDVDDGSMPIEDVISALRGFSGAYSKIASEYDPEGQHQIRVSAVTKSSFAVSIVAWAAEHQTMLLGALPAATAIVGLIIKVIELKKATKGQLPSDLRIEGNNNVVIKTGNNTTLSIPREAWELAKSRTVDAEIEKITTPLREGGIDAVTVSSSDREAVPESVVITSSEKLFFQSEQKTATTSSPVDLDGYLVSLNKESNRGSFRMQNGVRVRYRLAVDNPSQMYPDFAYKGPVRVTCVATFDANLEPKNIDISRITRLQLNLFGDTQGPS